mgnify:CR=1 FL=1
MVYSEMELSSKYFCNSSSYSSFVKTSLENNVYSNSLYSSVNLTLGEEVENQLTMQHAIRAKITTKFANKPLKLSLNYSHLSGGVLLGVEYNRRDYEISASYPVRGNLTVNLGYKNSKSNINYYSSSTTIFGIYFKPFTF